MKKGVFGANGKVYIGGGGGGCPRRKGEGGGGGRERSLQETPFWLWGQRRRVGVGQLLVSGLEKKCSCLYMKSLVSGYLLAFS